MNDIFGEDLIERALFEESLIDVQTRAYFLEGKIMDDYEFDYEEPDEEDDDIDWDECSECGMEAQLNYEGLCDQCAEESEIDEDFLPEG